MGQLLSYFITTKAPPVVTPARLISQVIVVSVPGQLQDLLKELILPFIEGFAKKKGQKALKTAAKKLHSPSKRSRSKRDLSELDSDTEMEDSEIDRGLDHILHEASLDFYNVETDYMSKMQVCHSFYSKFAFVLTLITAIRLRLLILFLVVSSASFLRSQQLCRTTLRCLENHITYSTQRSHSRKLYRALEQNHSSSLMARSHSTSIMESNLPRIGAASTLSVWSGVHLRAAVSGGE